MFLLGSAGTIDDGTQNDTLLDNAFTGHNCGHLDWFDCDHCRGFVLLAVLNWVFYLR